MSRQINLYTPAFKRQATLFSAGWTVAAAALIVAAGSAYYALASRQLDELRARRAEAEAQLKQTREQLATLGKAAQKPRSKALEEELARSEALLKSREELSGQLQSGEIGNREGYSKYLVALARQHVEGVWLTGIEVSGTASELALEGRAIRAELVSGYIKRLRNEEALRGKPIGTLALQEREIQPKPEQKTQPARAAVRVVEFRIGTAGSTGPGGGR